MKKQILALAAVASFGFAAQAQEVAPSYGFSEGNILIEGNVSFNSSKDKANDFKTNSFSFTPQVGYFLNDKFAAGVYFDLLTAKNPYNSLTERYDAGKQNDFNVGIFGRYYFLEAGKRFKFYGQAKVGYAHQQFKPEAGGKSKSNGVNAGLDLGVNYFVTQKIAVNFGFANLLEFNSTKPDGGQAQNNFSLNLNKFNNPFDTPTFGLTFVF
ncbi:porin family protein [Flavobacterium agricola]|uniref:Porin family protein n=1 Tax=Flavobacterium agricola TaxID=2870839 RepID=A0ABY6M2X6_9FLAO|nr:porin family protein [Flavobacterium agricola]UYW01521.1 porin family protein [Flavobacterium agricola]